jgi:hypothetical protein
VSLLTELEAFFTDHRHCGDLDAGVEGAVAWIACPCGARIEDSCNERFSGWTDDDSLRTRCRATPRLSEHDGRCARAWAQMIEKPYWLGI